MNQTTTQAVKALGLSAKSTWARCVCVEGKGIGEPITESNRWRLLAPAMNGIFEGQEYTIKWDFRNLPLDRLSEPLYYVPRKNLH